MPKLSASQIQTYAQNAGFTGNDLQVAVAIAQAESSGGDPNATGDLALAPTKGPSIGLWQIDIGSLEHQGQFGTASQLTDPQTNANAAYALYVAAGHTFAPWSTYGLKSQGNYGRGPYLAYMGQTPQPNQGPQPSQGPQLIPAALTTAPSANGYVYGYAGPPFNFLGHFCKTQFNTFTQWVNKRTGNFPAIQQFYQIRAAQLRKTAGVLNQFYTAHNDEVLNPTFNKNSWKAAPGGQFGYSFRNDQLPMVAMSKIKEYMRPQFQRQDESVFAMNQIRNIIEKTEDKAQYAWQAVNDSTQSIPTILTKINGYFGLPEYQAVLVNDQTDVYPVGSTQPRFRVHQLDAPTQYEIETNAHANPGQKVNIKEVPST